jgi:hypothetical protein
MKRVILTVLCILPALFFSGCVFVRFSSEADANAVAGKGAPEKLYVNANGIGTVEYNR